MAIAFMQKVMIVAHRSQASDLLAVLQDAVTGPADVSRLAQRVALAQRPAFGLEDLGLGHGRTAPRSAIVGRHPA